MGEAVIPFSSGHWQPSPPQRHWTSQESGSGAHGTCSHGTGHQLCEMGAALLPILQMRRLRSQETDSNPSACSPHALLGQHAALGCDVGRWRPASAVQASWYPDSPRKWGSLTFPCPAHRGAGQVYGHTSEEDLGARGALGHFNDSLLNASGCEPHFHTHQLCDFGRQ